MPRIKKSLKLVPFDVTYIQVGAVVFVKNFGMENKYSTDFDYYKQFTKGKIIEVQCVTVNSGEWEFIVQFDDPSINTYSVFGGSCWYCDNNEMQEEDFMFEVLA